MAAASPLRGFSFQPDALRLDWSEGPPSELPSLWLRDNCPDDRDARSGQRLADISELPDAPRIRGVSAAADALVVEWVGETRHASFPLDWLARHAPGRAPLRRTFELWLHGARLKAATDFAWLPLAELHADAPLRLDWMSRLLQQGIAFIRAVPAADRSILSAVAPFGLVVETNYGRVYDVRSVPRPENLAYSDRELGLHTDNPYRDPVPGFQALHCLIASGEGGENRFADGFALAEHLRASDPEAFAALSTTSVAFHYRSADAELYSRKPMIRLSTDGEVEAIHYNSRSIAPLSLPTEQLAPFYRAYRRFAALLHDERFELKVKLNDGELVVFDNHRILHGRTGFSSAAEARHLQGCYLARDSVYCQEALLRRQLEGRGNP